MSQRDISSDGLDFLGFDEGFEQVTVAVLFILATIAQQGDGLLARQSFEESKRELLALVFDSWVVPVHWRCLEQLFFIALGKIIPRDATGLEAFE
jgi:hypothetical protein